MNVAFASRWGSALSWAVRLQEEGAVLRMWVKERSHKAIGDGIVPKADSWPELLSWAKAQRGVTLVFFDYTDMGMQADEARRAGLNVIGGGDFMDRLEKNREFGQDIAESVGMCIPLHQEFSSLAEAKAFAKKAECGDVYLKPDNPAMGNDATQMCKSSEELFSYCTFLEKRYGTRGNVLIQTKIPGVAVSTARWWNGMSWVGPYEGTIENKKFLNDDLGPSTGCSFNAIWFYPQSIPYIVHCLNFESLTSVFRQNQAPPGIYDVNAILTDSGEAYFLEWTPRLGYDSETTSAALIPHLGLWLWEIASGRVPASPSGDLAYSVRLSVPPYPNEHVDRESSDTSHAVPLTPFSSLCGPGFNCSDIAKSEDGYMCVGTDGFVGTSLAVGDDLEELGEKTLDLAFTLHDDIKALQFRTDGAHVVQKDAQKAHEAGIEVHPGLL